MPPPPDTASLVHGACEAAPTAVLIADCAGTIVLVNGALERLFGYTRDELVGASIELVIPGGEPAIDGVIGRAAARHLDGRRWISCELIGRRKDGSRVELDATLRTRPAGADVLVLAFLSERQVRAQARDPACADYQEQLEFERFITELSLQFINVTDEQVDDAIHDGLARICDQHRIDRSTFYRLDPDGALRAAVCWTASGVPAAGGRIAECDYPWVLVRILGGQVLVFSTLDEIPGELDRDTWRRAGIKSAVIVPLSAGGRVAGALRFDTVHAERRWSPAVLHQLEVVGTVFDQVLARQQRDDAVRAASRQLRRVRDELQAENACLRCEVRERRGSTRIVGRSAALRRVLEQIDQVAVTDATVLLLGEAGTGKELLARRIHELGRQRARTMVRVNCAAVPASIIESELFGREKSAVTGASSRQIGRFELAGHSTIFLDEIGDLPADIQVKLLRVLEEGTIERLGNSTPIAVDVRIIAATHCSLEQRVAAGTFREDLYDRLNVFPIRVPPLRERIDDVPSLVWWFVDELSWTLGKRIDSIDQATLARLQQYAWPGNIRELRNLVERAMIQATGRALTIEGQAGPSSATFGARHGLRRRGSMH